MQNSDLPATKKNTGTQQAVQDYLDTLLQDATLQALVAPNTVSLLDVPNVVEEIAISVVEEQVVEEHIATVPRVVAHEETDVEVNATEADDIEVGLVETERTDSQELAQEHLKADGLSQEWINGKPSWAQGNFECLLFKVGGLTLAVPLVELGTVLTLDEELTPLFGQPDWFIGLMPSKVAGTVRVLDTAKKVMPEKYTEASRENLKYVILMKNSDWGLACHEVAEAIKLTPDEVRWRSDRGTRPWLAGTVINHMCAIMDVAALVDLVNQE